MESRKPIQPEENRAKSEDVVTTLPQQKSVKQRNILYRDIPYVPDPVDTTDLYVEDNKVHFKNLDENFLKNSPHLDRKKPYLPKSMTKMPYNIIYANGEYWAIYKGRKKAQENPNEKSGILGEGEFGAVKLILKDGIFYAYKQQKMVKLAEEEYHKLLDLGLAVNKESLGVRKSKSKEIAPEFDDDKSFNNYKKEVINTYNETRASAQKAFNDHSTIEARNNDEAYRLQIQYDDYSAQIRTLMERDSKIDEQLKDQTLPAETIEKLKMESSEIGAQIRSHYAKQDEIDATLGKLFREVAEYAEAFSVAHLKWQKILGRDYKEDPESYFIYYQRMKNTKEIDQYAMIMLLAEGMTLETLLKKMDNGFELDDLLIIKIGLETMKALNKINEAGYVHIDIKTANIMIDLTNQTAQMIDFGMAGKKNAEGYYLSTLRGDRKILPPEIQKIFEEFDKKIIEEVISYNDVAITNPSVPVPKVQYSDVTDSYALGSSLEILFSKIKDQALRNRFINLTDGLIAVDADKRLTLKKCIEISEDILNKKIPTEKNTLKVGLIDIDQYLQLNADERAKFIVGLPKYNEIWFYESEPKHNLLEYVDAKRDFQDHDFIVGNKVFLPRPDNRLENDVREVLNERKIPCVCETYVWKPDLIPSPPEIK